MSETSVICGISHTVYIIDFSSILQEHLTSNEWVALILLTLAISVFITLSQCHDWLSDEVY